MKKLLVICGPTATGKTRLALDLAKTFGGELLSADSRQVYRKMDIGTGKDLPVNSKLQIPNYKLGRNIGYYEIKGIRLWGYDLVDPKDEFSVSKYLKSAQLILKDIWKRGKLPILVGGTGLYIKSVVDGIPTISVPTSPSLRLSLAKKNVEELFEILAQFDALKAASMNSSDKKNPRRLLRAIEVAQWRLSQKPGMLLKRKSDMNTLFVGLNAPFVVLEQKILLRIKKRITQGFGEEVTNLLSRGVNWNHQSMDSLGYRQWKEYIIGKKTIEKVIQEWFTDEKNYAKRQITWSKKNKRIIWFDVSKESWKKDIENTVRRWHNNNAE